MSTPGIHALTHLGQLVRTARERSGPGGGKLSQTALGRRTGVGQVRIQRLETGKTTPSEELLDGIIAELDLTPSEAELMRRLRVLGAVGHPGKAKPRAVARYAENLLRLERLAAEILCWHELRIPGPIQSDRYMRAQFAAAGKLDVTPAAHERRSRRRLFAGRSLRRYDCLLYEEAVHRTAWDLGYAVAHDQIDFLISLIDGTCPDATERTRLRLVPRGIKLPDLRCDATILCFDGRRPDVLYLEHQGGGTYKQRKAEVDAAIHDWRKLPSYALDAADSIDLLSRLREEYHEDN